MKKALITGVTGQDGAYLAEFLLAKGYEVHGIKRRSSLFNTARIDNLYEDPHLPSRHFILHYGDMTDSSSLIHIVQKVQPDEIYNLAAQSHVQVSFEEPEYTANSDALGVLRLLEAIRILGLGEEDEVLPGQHLGTVWPGPGDTAERRPRRSIRARPMASPSSTATGSSSTTARPTACTPATGFFSTMNPRCAARPSSPARSPAAWRASRLACRAELYLGNLDARRDWGHARDYIEMQWLMLQQEKPQDYVIATGEQHSVREFVQRCAEPA